MEIKTYYRDYSLAAGVLSLGEDKISDIMNERQTQYEFSAEYKEAESVASALLQAIADKLTEGDKDLRLLKDSISTLEWLCFRAGYRAGIRDLVTAMTFNDAGLTKVAYIDYDETTKKRHHPLKCSAFQAR